MTPNVISRNVKVTHKVEFNSYVYDIEQYYDSNNTLVGDCVSVDGMPIGLANLAIRNKLFDFIKDYQIEINNKEIRNSD